jgi:hypothetical protein
MQPATPPDTTRRAQGAYYVASGIWPLLSMRTFEAVTGPKRDDWLVRTVGVLAAVIGAVLLAADRDDPPREVRLLGAASAAAFAAVDVVGVASRTISPIYLGDAALETGFLLGWLREGPGVRSGQTAPR